MKIIKSRSKFRYQVPSYVITRKDNEGCIAINLNNLKQYDFDGACAEIFYNISQKVSEDKIISDLLAQAKGKETLVKKEYERVIEFLLSKNLIEVC